LHAGFLGNDCTYIIDEAHLSFPFVETVEASRTYGADIRLITMTATPVSDGAAAIRLSVEDREHPLLKRRLHASKYAKLVKVPSAEKDFIDAAVAAINQFKDPEKVIGVVVNRVSTARRIWGELVRQKIRAELLTGRVRPYDRDLLMERLFPEIRAGRNRTNTKPLVIVATQTIEVGADIDFDALVTEAAPLDALRQRFGRLDRLGELGNAKAVIIYREPQQESGKVAKPDPIYGTAIQDTWEWLENVAQDEAVDFGITALEKKLQKLAPPRIEPLHAPVLLPSHVRLLCQTGPTSPNIDVSPWLHGAGRNSSDVSLVWRGDLTPDDPAKWGEIVSLRPPLTREALEVPLYAARAWLQGQRLKDVADLEGVPIEDIAASGSEKPLLRWRGQDDFKIIQPEELAAGDTIVLPYTYGGCDGYGWDPIQKTPVTDIADFCSLERRRNHVVRLVPGLTGWMGKKEADVQRAVAEVMSAATEVDPETGVDLDRIKAAHSMLKSLLDEIDHPLLRDFREKFVIELHPLGLVLRAQPLDEVDGTLHGGVAVSLDDHLKGVAQKAAQFATAIEEREKIIRAALIHDMGKNEPRFQVMLHGDPFKAAAGPALAKSHLRKLSEKRAAYILSGLPKGFRHELATLALNEEEDPLINYLVATHHGFGRPWFPLCRDQKALGSDRAFVKNGWLKTFALLSRKFNPWFLANMELIIRSADARQSMQEQEAADA
jgi:CRISPR-associated endonuclease/helicase Cas3